jgi:GT2 family glycosyltransferase
MKKNKPLTSILFLSYDLTQTMRNVTQASLSSIIKYTDEEDYELIWMDVLEKGYERLGFNGYYMDEVFEINKRDDRKKIELRTENEPDPGQYVCWNRLADMAKGEYLCFFQNDVFVNEGWLPKLRYYLDNDMCDAIFPDQEPRKRDFVKESYTYLPDTKDAQNGARNAGILYVKKDVFYKIGKWNEKMRIHNGEQDIYGRLPRFITTTQTMIIHVEHGSGYEKSKLYPQKYDMDCRITQGLV